MARIVVGTYIFRYPLGGMLSWGLQYVLGLSRLGHDVWVVERANYADACFDPVGRVTSDDPAGGAALVTPVLERFGLADRWAFLDFHGQTHGLSRAEFDDVLATADLFIDCGTHGSCLELLGPRCRTAIIDGEPGMTQMRWINREDDGAFVPLYDSYFTNGGLVGLPECDVPTCGRQWHPIPNPVATEVYPFTPEPPAGAAYTTVMNWASHKRFVFNGREYGQKDVMFEPYMNLPSRVDQPMEIAVAGAFDRQAVTDAGWRIRNAIDTTTRFDSYGDYIRESRGEFSVCKEVFVAARTGWFSDRSAAYLASGRPVVLMDTGFSEYLPVGEGLMAFNDVDSAAAAIDCIESDYPRHAKAARDIAVEYLEASKLMSRVVDIALA